MKTNFFSEIAQLDLNGNLHLIISKGAVDTLVVSTMLNNEQCGDKVKDYLIPLILRGTAQEFDEGYLEKITSPIKSVSGLMDNMEAYLKQTEEARKQSEMEKQKTEIEKKETNSREKKYTEAMHKADQLDREGKPREAWMKVPSPVDYPEYAEAIAKRKSELSSQFAPDLFGTASLAQTDTPKVHAVHNGENDNEGEQEVEDMEN